MNDISELLADKRVNSRIKPVLLHEYETMMRDGLKTRAYQGIAQDGGYLHRFAEMDYDTMEYIKEIAYRPKNMFQVFDDYKNDKMDDLEFENCCEIYDMAMRQSGKDIEYSNGIVTMYMRVGLTDDLEQKLLDHRMREMK
jgi:hypothetical protein